MNDENRWDSLDREISRINQRIHNLANDITALYLRVGIMEKLANRDAFLDGSQKDGGNGA